MVQKIGIYLFVILLSLVLAGWLGTKIPVKSFPTFGKNTPELETVPIPADLPAPVDRYFRKAYGEAVPVIKSAVVSGRASMRVNGITFPGRFRFTHLAGQGYRHYIEAALFGFPIMKVNEHYLDGTARLDLPFGVFEGEQVDQAANLGLWSETMWLSGVFLTDPRVRWEAVDDETAILVVPFEDEEQRFIVRFNPETGLIYLMEAMRFRDAQGGEKILWLSEARGWDTIDGQLIPAVGAAIWLDEGTPWAVFTVEEVVYNVDVETYIQVNGP